MTADVFLIMAGIGVLWLFVSIGKDNWRRK